MTHSEDNTIHFRLYNVNFKHSGTKVPKIELSSMGPFADLQLRRTKWASADVAKVARRVPRQLRPAKEKNVSRDAFGEKIGRVHMERQDFEKLQTRKMKALKKTKPAASTEVTASQDVPNTSEEE